MVFVAATAAGVLLQALVLLMMFVALKGVLRQLTAVSKTVEEHVLPTMNTGRRLLEDVAPSVRTTARNVADASRNAVDISRAVRDQSAQVGSAVEDLLNKAESQANRIDEMLTGTLDAVAEATATLQRSVSAPMRQAAGILSGLRAGFDVLRGRNGRAGAGADEDHFV